MFTWICPKCGREVPPAYDECPDCAGKTAAEAGPGAAPPPGGTTSFQQPHAAAPAGPRGRRPLWATGPQETTPAAPPAAAPPAPPVPQEAAIAPPHEEPPSSRPPKPVTSPLFQPAPEPSHYAVRQPAGPPKWLLVIATGVIVVVIVGAMYWFFGRPQTTSAVIVAPPPTTTAATDNPLQKYIEVTGIRFAPDSKGVEVKFVLINHSDSDLAKVSGTATVFAKTEQGQEIQVGTVKFETGIAAQASQELTLPFDTKMKLMEMPDWQNTSVKVQITSPSAA